MLWFRFKMFLLDKYQLMLCWKWWIYRAFNKSIPKEKFSTIIVFTSEIGDYLIFRPYLSSLKEKYGNLTLIGNKAFKSIAEYFDKDTVSNFIWVDKTTFNSAQGRKEQLARYGSIVADRLICPTFSRQAYLEDLICDTITSAEKIGILNPKLTKASNSIFTTQIETPSLFESHKFRDFVSTITGNPVIKSPSFDRTKLPTAEIPENYVVLFPSARMPYKRWEPVKFAEIGKKLHESIGVNIVLGGGPGDEEFTQPIAVKLRAENIPFTDLTAKTNLPQFTYVLANARLLLSNDTSSIHFATSVNCKTVVMLNATHFGRFCPYPLDVNSNIKALYPPELSEPFNLIELSKKFELRSFLDINTISTETVYKACVSMLES